MKNKEYAYLLDGEYLSSKFTDINELIESSVEDIIPQDWTVYENEFGEYIVLEVFETEDYEDIVNADSFVEELKNNSDAEWYLDDVNTNHLQEELNKFWKKYKEDNNITQLYYSGKRVGTYEVYVSYDGVDYNFLWYEVVKKESEN